MAQTEKETYATNKPLAVGLDREAVAKVIADHIAGGFDAALQDKQEWIDRRGLGYDCEPLDVNGPFKDDYLDAADAIIALAAPAVSIHGISLRGQQGEPAGMMTVTAHLSDGREVVLIEDNGNVISHWKNVRALPAAPTGETGA